MSSRYPAPVEISEHTGRNGRVEVVLEPIDQVEQSLADVADSLAVVLTKCAELSATVGKLQAAIASERERQTLSRLMTTQEVAKYLQVDDDTVRSLKQRGKLKAVQLGLQSPRYREADVAAFVESVRGR